MSGDLIVCIEKGEELPLHTSHEDPDRLVAVRFHDGLHKTDFFHGFCPTINAQIEAPYRGEFELEVEIWDSKQKRIAQGVFPLRGIREEGFLSDTIECCNDGGEAAGRIQMSVSYQETRGGREGGRHGGDFHADVLEPEEGHHRYPGHGRDHHHPGHGRLGAAE